MPLLLAMFALTGCGSSSSQKNKIESIYKQYKENTLKDKLEIIKEIISNVWMWKNDKTRNSSGSC